MSGAAFPRRTIVIGDVHGCLDELRDLLLRCEHDRARDRVVLVGDIVAKGPDSQGVVQLAREGGFDAVLGNHDAKVLSILRNGEESPHAAPASGVHADVAASLGDDDRRYLQERPLYLELPAEGAIVVHGGLVPGVALADQSRRFLLNLRSLAPDGTPSIRVDDGVPWASLWTGPQHVVFGHDALRGLQRHPFATGLDTGCVYGGALTALILPSHEIITTPAHRAYTPL